MYCILLTKSPAQSWYSTAHNSGKKEHRTTTATIRIINVIAHYSIDILNIIAAYCARWQVFQVGSSCWERHAAVAWIRTQQDNLIVVVLLAIQ